ncbi:MAG: helix-turn-helix domain-containing protein [Clostridiales bacterium]|nr:helix-turn-helix domain-containing protein [Clostridiales bacterium]
MEQTKTGAFLRQRRRELNLTQEQLAQQLGVSNKTISKWENGWTMPDYSIVPALCEALDITVAELIQGQEDEEKNAPLSEEQALELVERISGLEKMVRRLRNALRLMGVVVLLRGLGAVGFGVVSIVMAYAAGNLGADTLAMVVSASTSRIASGTVWLIGGGLILLVAHAMSSPRVKADKKDK